MSVTDDRPVRLDSKADLDDLLAARDRVLVEFHPDGCGICQSMEPVLDGVARSSPVVVATMNPRDDPVLIEEYDVRSVPKLLSFEDGELVGTKEDGFVPTDDVLELVGEH